MPGQEILQFSKHNNEYGRCASSLLRHDLGECNVGRVWSVELGPSGNRWLAEVPAKISCASCSQ